MGISVIGALPPAGAKEKRIVRFTSTSSWTAPAGVTYAIAHIVPGGGGGGGNNFSGGADGTASSVFSITANPGNGGSGENDVLAAGGRSGLANSGMGGMGATGRQQFGAIGSTGGQGRLISGGAVVVPGTPYTVTVGGGGAGGSNAGAGGSGFVEIEFYV